MAADELAVRHALEAAGVEFIDENGGGPGSTLAQRSAAEETQLVGAKLGYVSTLMRVQSAFEDAGIRLLDNDSGGRIAHLPAKGWVAVIPTVARTR